MKKANLVITSIFTVLYLFATIGTGMMAPFSVMAFDAPGSDKMLLPWIFMLTAFTWPLLFIFSLILSWVFYKLKKHKLSLAILLLPLLNMFVFILIFSGIFPSGSFAP